MLKSLTLERYRCFVRPTKIDLRPLTLLFGFNSVGKSAALRAFPLLAASCSAGTVSRSGPLALEHPAAMQATYSDIRTRIVDRNDLGITFGWAADDPIGELEFRLRDFSEATARQAIVTIIARDSDGNELLHGEFDTDRDCVVEDGQPVEFSGLRPKVSLGDATPLAACAGLLESLSSTVDWLGPLRTPPVRRSRRVAHPQVSSSGDGITEYLAEQDLALLARLSSFTKAIFGMDVLVRDDGGEAAIFMRLATGVEQHILDVGTGVGQSLPALLHIALAAERRANKRIIALEQPEAHLHPGAEVKLANALVTAIAESDGRHRPQFLVETHSENLLLSVQLAVLNKSLKPEDVVVYWFEKLSDESVIARKTIFEADAKPIPPWPPGVFAEDLELARQVLRARRASRA